jgi:hypothetical protein
VMCLNKTVNLGIATTLPVTLLLHKNQKVMRTFMGLLLVLLVITKMPAQNIPNAGFDSIYIGGIDRVYHWVTSDAVYFVSDTVLPFPPNTCFPPNSGNHHFMTKTVQVNYMDTALAHQMKSLVINNFPELRYPDGSQFNSFICNGVHFYSDAMGLMDMPLGGSPFPHRPAQLCGSYKFTDSLSSGNDFGRVEALLKRWNPVTLSVDTVATAGSDTELAPSSVWKAFSIPFVYHDTILPDSIVVIISASTHSTAPTSLFIDDIHFDFNIAVPEPDKPEMLRHLYPNPSRGMLQLLPLPDCGIRYFVCDLRGVEVDAGFSTDGRFNLSHLKPGIYTMILDSKGAVSRRKIILIR